MTLFRVEGEVSLRVKKIIEAVDEEAAMDKFENLKVEDISGLTLSEDDISFVDPQFVEEVGDGFEVD